MIDKLNNVNLVNFAGKKNMEAKHLPEKKAPNMSQQQVVISQDGAKALRNLALGMLAALGASTMATSCDTDPDIDFNHSCNTEVNVKICPLPKDTIRVNDTITVILPGEEIQVPEDYETDVADSLIAHGKNLGFEFEGEGKIPARIFVFDQWNSTSHDLVLDDKAKSEEKMVFIDQAKDFSKSAKNPEIRYNRIEFSTDLSRGVATELKKARVAGVKPASAMDWINADKVCLTNLKNGFDKISRYDSKNDLTQIGTLEKSSEEDVSFYDNLFNEYDEVDSFPWSEAKMVLANPKK